LTRATKPSRGAGCKITKVNLPLPAPHDMGGGMEQAGQSDFKQGLLAGLPFLLVLIPFALLFGVLATEAGLSLAQTMGFTVLVIAGSAQFTAIQLMSEQAPALIVLATSLAVNLRMAMYSAAMVPHFGPLPLWKRALGVYVLVDQSYGVSINRFERGPAQTPRQKFAFFVGSACVMAPPWYFFTYLGAVAGEAIPQSVGLDFALPITFIALFAPALRTLAHVAAAFVSVVLALALAFVPYSLGLIVAAGVAMLTGALVEIWQERRS